MSNTIQLPPPAKKLINSMRCMGYSFSTSLADIIDNSISAEAKHVHIKYNTLIQDPYVEVIDDGVGMSFEELKKALVFGTERDYSDNEFGRYGLGLKVASLAQCRDLMVCSKKDGIINCIGYSIDLIEKTNKWNALVFSQKEILDIPNIDILKNLNSGTIVLWRNFDFLMAESKPENFAANLRKSIIDARDHVSLVFHRIDNVEISFNDIVIPKRDPFLLDSKPRQTTGIVTQIDVLNCKIVVTPHTLPNANSLNSHERELLGLKSGISIYDGQGFYIYRNKRLIIWGSWLRMNSRNEFNKLARIQVDLPSSLDSIWELDVKKSSAKIPDFIKEKLKTTVLDSMVKSKKVIVMPGKLEESTPNKIWLRREFGKEQVSYELNKDNPFFTKLYNEISPDLLPYLEVYLKQIERNLPKFKIKDDIEENYSFINKVAESEDDLKQEVIAMLREINTINRDDLLMYLINQERYKCLKDRIDEIKKELCDE